MIKDEPLSRGMRFLDLEDVMLMFSMTKVTAIGWLGSMGVPILRHGDKTRVLALALELGILGQMMPGGEGFVDPTTVPIGVSHPGEAWELLSKCFVSLDYWREFRKNPHGTMLILALAGVMYGGQDDAEVKKRLWALGDALVRDAMFLKDERDHEQAKDDKTSRRRLKDSHRVLRPGTTRQHASETEVVSGGRAGGAGGDRSDGQLGEGEDGGVVDGSEDCAGQPGDRGRYSQGLRRPPAGGFSSRWDKPTAGVSDGGGRDADKDAVG